MRPLFEKVTVPEGRPGRLLNRRLDDGIPFQWHYHPEFELTLTLNSRGQRYIGDSIATYDDGDLVLLGPNLPHTWCSMERLDASAPAHRAGDVVHRGVGRERDHGTRRDAAGCADAGARRARHRVLAGSGRRRRGRSSRRYPARAPADRLIRLMEVLTLLAADEDWAWIAGPGADRLKVASPDQARVERVLDHIHAHYREPISIATLADVAALSPSGFHRLFRRHTRLTVNDYVAELRIGQACALLVNSSRPIAHIAEDVGYANLANFNRRFLALKRMTPRTFRQSFAAH